MGDDQLKPKRLRSKKRRVNRKRKAVRKAKEVTPTAVVWAVCHNTEKDWWQVLVFSQENHKVVDKGKVVEGRNNAFETYANSL